MTKLSLIKLSWKKATPLIQVAFSLIKSTPNTIKKSVITKSSGKFIYSMKLWSLKSRITQFKIKNSQKTSQNFKKLKNNGIIFGPKSLKRKLEERLIWLKKVTYVLSKNVEKTMALMFLLIYTWSSNIIVGQKLKDKPLPKKFV